MKLNKTIPDYYTSPAPKRQWVWGEVMNKKAIKNQNKTFIYGDSGGAYRDELSSLGRNLYIVRHGRKAAGTELPDGAVILWNGGLS